MALEIGASISFSLANGSLVGSFAPGSFTDDQATPGWMQFNRAVTQAAELDISFPDIVTNGWVVIKNLDSTNYVKYGPKSAGVMVEFGRIKAGKSAMFFLAPGVTLRMVANTADCRCEFSHANA